MVIYPRLLSFHTWPFWRKYRVFVLYEISEGFVYIVLKILLLKNTRDHTFNDLHFKPLLFLFLLFNHHEHFLLCFPIAIGIWTYWQLLGMFYDWLFRVQVLQHLQLVFLSHTSLLLLGNIDAIFELYEFFIVWDALVEHLPYRLILFLQNFVYFFRLNHRITKCCFNCQHFCKFFRVLVVTAILCRSKSRFDSGQKLQYLFFCRVGIFIVHSKVLELALQSVRRAHVLHVTKLFAVTFLSFLKSKCQFQLPWKVLSNSLGTRCHRLCWSNFTGTFHRIVSVFSLRLRRFFVVLQFYLHCWFTIFGRWIFLVAQRIDFISLSFLMRSQKFFVLLLV